MGNRPEPTVRPKLYRPERAGKWNASGESGVGKRESGPSRIVGSPSFRIIPRARPTDDGNASEAPGSGTRPHRTDCRYPRNTHIHDSNSRPVDRIPDRAYARTADSVIPISQAPRIGGADTVPATAGTGIPLARTNVPPAVRPFPHIMQKYRPVLYLDLDDTLLTWAASRPLAAPGAREFVLWALEHYEIRWLTRWCPTGSWSPAEHRPGSDPPHPRLRMERGGLQTGRNRLARAPHPGTSFRLVGG
jgi:hypothetical protein